MKSFFALLLYASVIGGLGTALVGKAYRKHIQSLAALLCTAVIVAPLISLAADFSTFSPFDYEAVSVDGSLYESLLTEQARADAEKTLCDYIFSETGIKVLGVSIDIESKEEGLVITALSVNVHTAQDAEVVEALLLDKLENTVRAEVVCES